MTKRQTLDEQIAYAKKIVEELESKKATVNSLLQEIKDNKTAGDDVLKEINNTKTTGDDSLKKIKDTKTKNEKILKDIENAQPIINNAKDDVLKVREIFEDKTDDKGNSTPSLKTKIEKFFEEIKNKDKDFEEQRKTNEENFDEKKEKILKNIADILAKTSSIGLTKAYIDAKSKYGSTPIYSNLPKNFFIRQFFKFYHWSKGNISTFFYYCLFLFPLAAIIFLFKDYLSKDAELEIGLLVFRFTISFPLVLVSLFGLSSIRMNRKLYEEYNHKHRVMQLYNSFLKEIENKGTEEEQRELRKIMLETVQDKTSLIKEKETSNKEIKQALEFFKKKKDEG